MIEIVKILCQYLFIFNIDYANKTKEERLYRFRVSLNNYEDSPYRVKGKVTRLQIIITSGNLTKEFSSKNTVENITKWIEFIGVSRIMQFEHLFSDYFRLTKIKNNLEVNSVINDQNGTYYLYLKASGNDYRKTLLEKIMNKIHGEGNYIILLD